MTGITKTAVEIYNNNTVDFVLVMNTVDRKIKCWQVPTVVQIRLPRRLVIFLNIHQSCVCNEPCANAVRTDFADENRSELWREQDVECWLQQLLQVIREPATFTMQPQFDCTPNIFNNYCNPTSCQTVYYFNIVNRIYMQTLVFCQKKTNLDHRLTYVWNRLHQWCS